MCIIKYTLYNTDFSSFIFSLASFSWGVHPLWNRIIFVLVLHMWTMDTPPGQYLCSGNFIFYCCQWLATSSLQLAKDGYNGTAICTQWNNIVARMKTEEFLTVVFQSSTVTSDPRSVGVTNEQNSILTSQKVPLQLMFHLPAMPRKLFGMDWSEPDINERKTNKETVVLFNLPRMLLQSLEVAQH